MTRESSEYPLVTTAIATKLKEADLAIQKHTFLPEQLILTKGDVSEQIHIILSGQVRVYIEQERKIQLALLEREQFFGEMSCLTGDPISANVEAVDEVQTISVCRKGMMLLMDQNAAFRMQIIENMVKRIQNSNDRVVEEHQKSLLLMKHHETEEKERYGELIGNSSEMQKLHHDIATYAKQPVPILIIGEPGTEKISAARKIHEQSTNRQYPFIIVDANGLNLESWQTKIQVASEGTIVVEHADLLPGDILKQLIESTKQTRLIFTAVKALPASIEAVIPIPPLRERVEDIPLIAQHYAMKAGATNMEGAISPDSLRLLKLFPFLTKNVEELRDLIYAAFILSEGRTIYSKHLRFGKNRKPGERPKVGLALGSGSARGCAHIGVMRVLEQEGIPIDMIAGTSAGSMIGGAYAAGMSLDDATRLVSKLRWRDFLRPTLTKQSFAHNLSLVDYIEKHIGDVNIEDLNIPFAAVASDVLTGEAHIMKHGSLAYAVTASTAIPSLIRPVQYQEKTLVDGAIVHPVPAALVKSMGADIVIAVNVCAEVFSKEQKRNFVDSILNTIDIMSARLVTEELQLADVILRPDLGTNQIRFSDALFCANAGEVVTKEALARIHQKLQSN